MWDGNIKVITGLRRSGKSTLLFELFYDYLVSVGTKEENIIKLELEKKIVIRDDIPHHFYDEKGFLHCSLLDFLLDRVELF